MLVLVVAACGSTKHAPDAAPPDAGPCTSDDQCTLSRRQSVTDCCGALCVGQNVGYHVDDLAQLERASRCTPDDYAACPRAECGPATSRFTAVCRAGRCEADETKLEIVRMTWETHCTHDADCQLSNLATTTGCCGSCEEHFAYDEAAFAAMANALRQRCPGFCMADCGRPPWRERAVCDREACAVERSPW